MEQKIGRSGFSFRLPGIGVSSRASEGPGTNSTSVDVVDFLSPSSRFSAYNLDKSPSYCSLDRTSSRSVSFNKCTPAYGWEACTAGYKPPDTTWLPQHTGGLGEKIKLKCSREKLVLDPNDPFIQRWNQIFVVSCLVAIFIDPLFFFLPVINAKKICVQQDMRLAIFVTVIRSCTDLLFLVHILLQFRTAFIAPSSKVFGRGELVTDLRQIAARYIRKAFWLDVIAALPYPQMVTWLLIPLLETSSDSGESSHYMLRLLVGLNYLPRLYCIFQILKSSEMSQTIGDVIESVWAGAMYNLLLYMLASHVLGACWYVLAVERQNACWRKFCKTEETCNDLFFDCAQIHPEKKLFGEWTTWINSTSVGMTCTLTTSSHPNNLFNYGIFAPGLTHNITTTRLSFLDKYLYCFWFGLINLSSLSQNLAVSSYIWDIYFAIAVTIAGILLFALLIGNMQQHLQSRNLRLDQMRIKRRDTEQWMGHRQLPEELRERVRRHDRYKWVATRGVDEISLLGSLPLDLRREIKLYLCLDLLRGREPLSSRFSIQEFAVKVLSLDLDMLGDQVKRVPLFNQMDDRLLDAICERLQPTLLTENSYLVREGDPVKEMVFIIRGHLESVTTNGDRTGFTNSETLGPGDFCGEELLTWALDPRPNRNLPSSTLTVKGLMEVEGFSLKAHDLKAIAGQLRRLHSKHLQHTFRYYSNQWRSWAACCIQGAWKRYRRRKLEWENENRIFQEIAAQCKEKDPSRASFGVGATFYASLFATNAMRAVHRVRQLNADAMTEEEARVAMNLVVSKPFEPNFNVER